jgi:hypothetical protein
MRGVLDFVFFQFFASDTTQQTTPDGQFTILLLAVPPNT